MTPKYLPKMPRNLLELNLTELTSFFKTFDIVLCDCDGVLWLNHVPIPGVEKALSGLKKRRKNIHFVTNNSTVGIKHILNGLHKIDEAVEDHDVVIPTQAIISYLKDNDFNKKLFVLGADAMKQDLATAGFSVANTENVHFPEVMQAYKDDKKYVEEIGACILDIDYGLTFKKLTEFMMFLQDEDVLFIVGATDKTLPIAKDKSLIGPWYFENMLQEKTKRASMRFGKPSLNLHKFLKKKYEIGDPSRVLFIGDSLEQDIQFGLNAEYQTLLVLTGVTNLKHLEDSNNLVVPDYYLNSLADLNQLLND